MAAEHEKEALAKGLTGRADLISLWEQIKAGETPQWAPGDAFEYLIIRAFDMEGLHVRWPYHVTLPQKVGTVEQIDGAVYFQERGFLIESKDQYRPKDIEPVAKLRIRLERRPPGTMGILFSTQGFTVAAELFAQFSSPMNVLFWSREDVQYAVVYGKMCDVLRYKMRYAVEEGLSHVLYSREDI
jgi:hypothetical protein